MPINEGYNSKVTPEAVHSRTGYADVQSYIIRATPETVRGVIIHILSRVFGYNY